MLMTIMWNLLLTFGTMAFIAIYHGWVDAKYSSNSNNEYLKIIDKKAMSVIVGCLFYMVCILEGVKIGVIVLGVTVAAILVGKVLIKFAKFFHNYSFRKFSGIE